tara:strand:- start:117 stop:947 length:831 start_codon:yes stop_codon:yes gene_type:complete
MKFTIQIKSGLCNVLKSFVTALSIGETNLAPGLNLHFDADWREIIDDSLICHGPHEFGESFISARLLILKSEESEQPDLINDAKSLGDHPNITNKGIAHLFSTHSIDWFFDRHLICDKVYNRIQDGISKVKWRPEVLSEVNRITKDFDSSTLAVQIRTWNHKFDPPNCTSIRDGVIRDYNFDTYKKAIDEFLPKTKTVFLTSDDDSVLPEYIDYLNKHNIKVITYTQPDNVTFMQYSAATMLIGSKCDMLVCSRLSTFAECMWWFGGCKAKVTPVF